MASKDDLRARALGLSDVEMGKQSNMVSIGDNWFEP
jgi:hypothetical protein